MNDPFMLCHITQKMASSLPRSTRSTRSNSRPGLFSADQKPGNITVHVSYGTSDPSGTSGTSSKRSVRFVHNESGWCVLNIEEACSITKFLQHLYYRADQLTRFTCEMTISTVHPKFIVEDFYHYFLDQFDSKHRYQCLAISCTDKRGTKHILTVGIYSGFRIYSIPTGSAHLPATYEYPTVELAIENLKRIVDS